MGVKVRERGGAWWLFINYKGRRKAKRVGAGKAAKKAAQLAATQIAAKLVGGDTSVFEDTRAKAQTFREFAESWLKTDVALRLKPATQENYRIVMERHWLPALGSLPLTAITRERIKAVLADKHTPANPKSKGLKTSSLRTACISLRSCLNTAVEAGLIPGNPALHVRRLLRQPEESEARIIDPFTPSEMTTLLETAEAQMPEQYALLLTLARTGVRIGEALALKREDVDLAQQALWVRRTWSRKQIGTPKSGKGRRVDMSQQLARVLRGYLSVQEAEAVVSGRAESPWLFPEPGGSGGPMRPMWCYRHVWWPLLKRSGLRYRNPHALRHTYASRLIANGESLAYVRDQLGHASIKITVDTYGHLVPGANRQAVDRLDDATGRNLYATAPRAEGAEGEEGRVLNPEREYFFTK